MPTYHFDRVRWRPYTIQKSPSVFIRRVRELAADSGRIVILRPHAHKRMLQRRITPRQVQLCLQKGTLTEGPVLNAHGNWKGTVYRHAAGEEIEVTVAIEADRLLLVVTVF